MRPPARYGTIPSPEPPAIASLDGLAPRFRASVEQVLTRMQALGFPTRVRESLRTDKRQRWLYGFGRYYDDGRGIVTDAATAHVSWHFYGLAVDFENTQTLTDQGELDYRNALVGSVDTMGLRSGSGFARLNDWDHAQFGLHMRVSPSPLAYALYVTGGNQAVWKAVGAA